MLAAPLSAVWSNPWRTFDAIAKVRAERSMIDFVELFWVVIDPSQPFVRGNVQELICSHLEDVTNEKILNLLINVPPGFTKSRLVNVFWPAFEWGPKHRPDLRYVSWSYSLKLTRRDNEDCRKIINSPLYQKLWGQCSACLARKQGTPRCARCEKDRRFRWSGNTNAKDYYENDWGGFRIASSVGGAGTGMRADRLIFDDPHNVKQGESDVQRQATVDWFAGTLPTRVRNADGNTIDVPIPGWVRRAHALPEDYGRGEDGAKASATVGIMQRLALQDVAGVILSTPELGYTHLMIEMEYQGEGHPARTIDPVSGVVPLRPRAGYVDVREERCKATHVELAMRSGPQLVEIPLDVAPATSDAGDVAWSDFCNVWLRVGHYAWSRLADPIRFPRHVVEKLKSSLRLKQGSDAVASQFQQWPQEVGGDMFPAGIIDAAHMLTDDQLPRCKAEFKTRGWDLAATDDDSAAATVGFLGYIAIDDRVIVEDVVKLRGEPDAVDALLKRTAHRDGPNVRQDLPRDPGQAGKWQTSAMTRTVLKGFDVVSSPEAGSKTRRASPGSSQWKAGNVYFRVGPLRSSDSVNPREVIRVMSQFPVGREKDEVDAFVRMLASQVAAPEPENSPMPPRSVKLQGVTTTRRR
jgi:predicted phage terminase large subunit-like protein